MITSSKTTDWTGEVWCWTCKSFLRFGFEDIHAALIWRPEVDRNAVHFSIPHICHEGTPNFGSIGVFEEDPEHPGVPLAGVYLPYFVMKALITKFRTNPIDVWDFTRQRFPEAYP